MSVLLPKYARKLVLFFFWAQHFLGALKVKVLLSPYQDCLRGTVGGTERETEKRVIGTDGRGGHTGAPGRFLCFHVWGSAP